MSIQEEYLDFIIEAMFNLLKKDDPVDIITISSEMKGIDLERWKRFEKEGYGTEYIGRVMDYVHNKKALDRINTTLEYLENHKNEQLKHGYL